MNKKGDAGASSCPSLGTCGPQKTLGAALRLHILTSWAASISLPQGPQVSLCDSQTPTEHQRALWSRGEGDHHFPVTHLHL